MARSVICLGVVGVGRGYDLARSGADAAGMRVVALCDQPGPRLERVAHETGATAYSDFDRFLAHDCDAVIIANYYHQHAPLAIKALAAGKHVLSETAACFTLAEGVALIRAVERSGRTYMLAENYPYIRFNQEMRRLYLAGRIGEFVYGEGEYLHPMDARSRNRISPGRDHWRNWLPATYYCTHALAPLMYITDTWPVQVSGFVIPRNADDPVQRRTAARNDPAALIVLRMSNGAVVKLLQVYLRGESVWVRLHGTRGQMENLRHGDTQMVRLRREQFHERRRDPLEQIYLPNLPPEHARAAAAGHGGGDYFVNHYFAQALRTGQPPFLDVYRAVAMSIIGPLAYRSALAGGVPADVPDLREERNRRKYVKDTWSPDPANTDPNRPWPSVEGDVQPTRAALRHAQQAWNAERRSSHH